jgi:hypothetical protein
MSTLSEKQRQFTKMIGQLILWSYDHGYELTFGEAYRTPEQAALNAKKGIGIANSLHIKRLAVDFNLFVGGKYTSDPEDYLPLVLEWEQLGGSAGYRFKSKDAGHFSLEFNGVK